MAKLAFEKEVVVKILVLGGKAVGKTSLVRSYTSKPNPGQYVPTSGTDVSVAHFGRLGERHVRLHLWDVAHGQISANEGHVALLLDGIAGVLLVFDVSNAKSLQDVDAWRRLLAAHFTSRSLPMVLLAHKQDRRVGRAVARSGNADASAGQAAVTAEVLDEYARAAGLRFWRFSTTARSGSSVKEAIDSLVSDEILGPRAAMLQSLGAAANPHVMLSAERPRSRHGQHPLQCFASAPPVVAEIVDDPQLRGVPSFGGGAEPPSPPPTPQPQDLGAGWATAEFSLLGAPTCAVTTAPRSRDASDHELDGTDGASDTTAPLAQRQVRSGVKLEYTSELSSAQLAPPTLVVSTLLQRSAEAFYSQLRHDLNKHFGGVGCGADSADARRLLRRLDDERERLLRELVHAYEAARPKTHRAGNAAAAEGGGGGGSTTRGKSRALSDLSPRAAAEAQQPAGDRGVVDAAQRVEAARLRFVAHVSWWGELLETLHAEQEIAALR